MRLLALVTVPLWVWMGAACDSHGRLAAEAGEEFSGGDVTVFNTGENAFGLPAPQLSREEERFFGVGNSFFNQNWVQSPASTTARDGLGPFFNARSCAACHFKDGRGRAPEFDGERPTGWIVRLGVPGQVDVVGGPVGDTNYGTQIQDGAILGFAPEATPVIRYEEIAGTFADGTPYSLRKPLVRFEDTAYGPIAGVSVSARVANHLSGLGLLDAVPEADLLAREDPNDLDGDGISGRANRVWSVAQQQHVVGRFGWKAEQPTVRQQVASAFHGDMGLTSSLFSDENCTVAPAGCNEAPNGGAPEIVDDALTHTTLYASTLAVPARRDWDNPQVLRGKEIFSAIGCASCHVPQMETGTSTVADALSGQTIRPYTDLLLHDMGDGLADDLATFDASGREWRTPPLWGLGLFETVNGHMNLLHDGRARGVVEAILWHGGEAEASREQFRRLSRDERDDLVRFLHSL
ncbi:MAG: di-heme oxidoredictase family protein [Bacteroidota bacterium]